MSWFFYCLTNIHACLFVYPLLFSSSYCWLPNGMRKWILPYKTEKDLIHLFYCTFVFVCLECVVRVKLMLEDCSSILVHGLSRPWISCLGSKPPICMQAFEQAVMQRGSCPSRLLCFLLVYPMFVFKHLYDATAAAVYRSGLSENISLSRLTCKG